MNRVLNSHIYTFIILFSLAACHSATDQVTFSEDKIPSPSPIYYIGDSYRIKGILYEPQEYISYSERGAAGIYYKAQDNGYTTNNEKFDPNELTASHKTLPLPSIVRITNLENKNTAIVRINDRGPQVNNRLIDVSPKVAAALEFQAFGTTLVQVDLLPLETKKIREELLASHNGVNQELKGDASESNEVSPTNGTLAFSQGDETEIPLGVHTPIYVPSDSEIAIYNEENDFENVDGLPLDLNHQDFEEESSENVGIQASEKQNKEKTEPEVLYDGFHQAKGKESSPVEMPKTMLKETNISQKEEKSSQTNGEEKDKLVIKTSADFKTCQSNDSSGVKQQKTLDKTENVEKMSKSYIKPVIQQELTDEKNEVTIGPLFVNKNTVSVQGKEIQGQEKADINQNIPSAKSSDELKEIVHPTKEDAPYQSQNKEGHLPPIYIQIGAFKNPKNADLLTDELQTKGFRVFRVNKKEFHILRLGPFENEKRAKEMLDKLHQAGYPEAQVHQ